MNWALEAPIHELGNFTDWRNIYILPLLLALSLEKNKMFCMISALRSFAKVCFILVPESTAFTSHALTTYQRRRRGGGGAGGGTGGGASDGKYQTTGSLGPINSKLNTKPRQNGLIHSEGGVSLYLSIVTLGKKATLHQATAMLAF